MTTIHRSIQNHRAIIILYRLYVWVWDILLACSRATPWCTCCIYLSFWVHTSSHATSDVQQFLRCCCGWKLSIAQSCPFTTLFPRMGPWSIHLKSPISGVQTFLWSIWGRSSFELIRFWFSFVVLGGEWFWHNWCRRLPDRDVSWLFDSWANWILFASVRWWAIWPLGAFPNLIVDYDLWFLKLYPNIWGHTVGFKFGWNGGHWDLLSWVSFVSIHWGWIQCPRAWLYTLVRKAVIVLIFRRHFRLAI